ncbi:IS200/IS605 family transposase [Flavobacteriaceae bacterium F08102]|nr:IS200/IS605 family transposase [Flavobacteriaceae bacterium F08102]
MASGTYTQIYIHIVFAVKHRRSLIDIRWEEDLFKYITGIIQNKGQKLLAINGMPDHIHILIGMRPKCCLSDLVREIKKSSNRFISEKKYVRGVFSWQEGFGAFSYSYSALENVINYINNQKEHHRKVLFKDEYRSILDEQNVDYEDRFLFEWIQ